MLRPGACVVNRYCSYINCADTCCNTVVMVRSVGYAGLLGERRAVHQANTNQLL